MNELEQLKAKYQELGVVIERMEKDSLELKPSREGYATYGDGECEQVPGGRPKASWNIMPTKEDAERLGKIFQAVAEQEHLVRFVNGDWEFHVGSIGIGILFDAKGHLAISSAIFRPDAGSPRFKDKDAVERALKLASPNLLAYWKREL